MQTFAIPILFGLLLTAVIVGTMLALRFPDDLPKQAEPSRVRPQRQGLRPRLGRR